MKTVRSALRTIAVWLLLFALLFVFAGCFASPASTTAGTTEPAVTEGVTEGETAAETTGENEPAAPSPLIALLSENEEIPAFKPKALERMHLYYSRYYIREIGTDEEMAAAIADFYLTYHDLIDETDEDEVTDLLCECYLSAAGDKYAYYMNPEALAEHNSDMAGTYVGIGVQVTNDAVARRITVTAVFPDTPAYDAGVLAGDTIEGVGDTSADEITFAELVNRIRGQEGTEVTVTFARNGEPYTRTMTRRTVIQVTASGKLLPGSPKIGLISITEFDDSTFPQFKAALDALLDADGDGLDEDGDGKTDPDIDGLVFDVRNNPGGYLSAILHVLDYMMPDGTPLANYEYYNGQIEYDAAHDGFAVLPADLPIAVICNEHTASAGELFTCAMQDYGREGLLDVTVVGVVTYGKGTMQTQVYLTEGPDRRGSDDATRATTISFALYNPPYSENYEGVGIIPDLVVELSEEAKQKSIYVLTEEEDVQRAAALASVTERAVGE
ncbi:MAG: PDZ domain-containing protein [Clostridia bacterium]|nr:PDZ domain-containing protein [Clostridia bacterium]